MHICVSGRTVYMCNRSNKATNSLYQNFVWYTEHATPPPVNTKWIKIFKRRPEYMITSRSWVAVHNPSKIGSPDFAGRIGKVYVFYYTHRQSNKFFHLAYRSQIWKDLKHLWLKTRGFTPRCAFLGYRWWQIMFRGPNPQKPTFWDHSMQNLL